MENSDIKNWDSQLTSQTKTWQFLQVKREGYRQRIRPQLIPFAFPAHTPPLAFISVCHSIPLLQPGTPPAPPYPCRFPPVRPQRHLPSTTTTQHQSIVSLVALFRVLTTLRHREGEENVAHVPCASSSSVSLESSQVEPSADWGADSSNSQDTSSIGGRVQSRRPRVSPHSCKKQKTSGD